MPLCAPSTAPRGSINNPRLLVARRVQGRFLWRTSFRETGQDGNRGSPIKLGRRYISLGRSGQRTSRESLGFFANFWGQSAVSSSIQAKSFLPRPYFPISTASRYWPDRPHLAHSIRTAPSLPTKSPNVIAL